MSGEPVSFPDMNSFLEAIKKEQDEFKKYMDDYDRAKKWLKNSRNRKSKKLPPYVQKLLDEDIESENTKLKDLNPPTNTRIKEEIITEVVPKGRITRSNKPKTHLAVKEEFIDGKSDIIIQNPVVDVVELDSSKDQTVLKLDNDVENEVLDEKLSNLQMPAPKTLPIKKNTRNNNTLKPIDEVTKPITRTTRASQRIKDNSESTVQQKRERSKELKRIESVKKRSKSQDSQYDEQDLADDPQNKTTATEYEDAVSDNEAPEVGNKTFLKNPNVIDKTLVISIKTEPEYHKDNNFNKNICDQTPSTSSSKVPTSNTVVVKKVANQPANVSELLTDDESLEEASPVKMKVRVFEKLNHVKASAQKKTKTFMDSPLGTVKEKAQMFTPLNQKVMKTNGSTLKNTSMVSSASKTIGSATKTTSSIFRSRELRKQERDELRKKQEAEKQAQLEEKKKQQKERFLKAQQQRQALEMERIKNLEQQKIKEEKSQLLLKAQQKQLEQQKEANEQKRLQAKQKADKIKKEEDCKTFTKQIFKPVYLTEPLPRMPTTDCYDSDEEQNYKPILPSWSRGRELLKHVRFENNIKLDFLKNKFFCAIPQFPNLNEVMECNINLKRTSSAIWAHRSVVDASILEED